MFQNGEELPNQGFTLKSVSTMLFGQDSLETKQEKLLACEQQVKDAEELVKIAENDVKWVIGGEVFVKSLIKNLVVIL